jgi:hypothetical protein
VGRAAARKKVRRRYVPPGPDPGWSFGYLHPSGRCPHEPACSPDRSRCAPQPKQALAHASPSKLLFFGGAVGGGKSEFAIVEAITYCLTYPGTQVAIFRRTHPELEQSILGRFLELVPPEVAHYSSSSSAATFYNRSKLWFCYVQHEKDVYKYQSAQWAALFIDEAGHFTEFIVRYLITRVRLTGAPNIIRLTGNPGGPGHGFLKRWFLKPEAEELGPRALPAPGEVWRPLPKKEDPTPPADVPTRQFIRARFADNIALKEARPDYLAQIYQLGGDKARQLAEGDWDAADGMIVGAHWRERWEVRDQDKALIALGFRPGQTIPWHVIPIPNWQPPADATIFGSVDYGYGAPWAFHLHAALPGGHIRTFFEFYLTRVRDVDQAKKIRQVLEVRGYRPDWIVLEPIMWASREETGKSKTIAEVYHDELRDLTQLRRSSGGRPARVSRPQRWIAALHPAADGLPNWTVTTACPHLIRTVPEVPWDEEDREVEDEDSENHCYEGVGRFFEARPFAPPPPPPDPLAELDALSRAHHKARQEAEAPVRRGALGGLASR